jgi:hypothetical protein
MGHRHNMFVAAVAAAAVVAAHPMAVRMNVTELVQRTFGKGIAIEAAVDMVVADFAGKEKSLVACAAVQRITWTG